MCFIVYLLCVYCIFGSTSVYVISGRFFTCLPVDMCLSVGGCEYALCEVDAHIQQMHVDFMLCVCVGSFTRENVYPHEDDCVCVCVPV